MPIFHDQDELPPPRPVSQQSLFVESQRAGYPARVLGGTLLDGMLAENPTESSPSPGIDPVTPNSGLKMPVLTRVELIERIKRGKSPSWPQLQNNGDRYEASPDSRPTSRGQPKTPLLSSPGLKISRTPTPDPLREHASAGIEIERPRSALHSGDFREKKENTNLESVSASSAAVLATSPVAPWHHSFPAAAYPSSRAESPFSFHETLNHESRLATRSRAISQSSFSSFVFMPPTSPLVQQSNNTDLDFSSRPTSRQSSISPERSNRRHTFSPHSFQTLRSMQMATSASGTPAARHLRREGAFPYQAHQPRRSLTSFTQFQPHSSPQTPLLNSRRPSCSSDASPLHHAPMVGSYEESILRGRMSTTPSRPLNFVAKIGVLGKGECKSNLKCPPHVTVPFPAVFYSYGTGNGRIADDSPSPYVGLIDLENSLSPPAESSEAGKRKRRHTVPHPDQDDIDFQPSLREEQPYRIPREDIRRREKRKRRSISPKSPPGGSYRIPQQGQLQIVLKNPNKTAVKLFLVPYDLSDMEPGQKTFVRQRSYSAGPIIDMPMSSRKNLGTDRPEAALSSSDDPNDRPILRYLIHLHMCCPSKGRYYLYKSIRVVFANRVPDGKEKLRNEIQLPEPRYSAYKPTRDSLASQSTSLAATHLASEKALRRRSAAFSLSHQAPDPMENPRQHPPLPPPAIQFTGGNANSSSHFSTPMPALQSIPFSLTRLPTIDSRPVSRDPMDIDSDTPFQSRTNASSPRSGFGSPENNYTDTFEKLNKGDVGYGGNAFCGVGGSSASPGAGLLTRRLRGLDVHQDEDREREP
ncbi:hypothetical protein K505DRAFT_313498 [Melanomma pulvis-pyrius CBS 109.77]|uniref:Atos-like conserved domain-containing protein n=1 Tax=Melanomma pulvis-pyrius CBS 109.77 TaxID=1314802 RepID=A0A6A6WZX7_9PLEO|nr:hypothetical protein K505DRAFT_313498 [Melanomma pulvis-pyrius CBS 109.77]